MYRFFIISTSLIVLLAGCMTPVYIPGNQEFTMTSYYPPEDTRYRAYSALLLSLKDRKWKVTKLDLNNNLFEAQYCHKITKDCLSMRGEISNKWDVSFKLYENQFDGKHVRRWIDNLQRSYSKYSSYSTNELTYYIKATVFWESIKDLEKT